jgi:hypothetical protein
VPIHACICMSVCECVRVYTSFEGLTEVSLPEKQLQQQHQAMEAVALNGDGGEECIGVTAGG